MDLTDFSAISSFLSVLTPLGAIALFVWVILRTESRHTWVYRLWRLIHGNKEVSDPEVNAYINEQNSLMSFRLIAGIPVRTLEHAHQLIRWTKLHNVEMFALRMSGEYFDPDLRKIRVDKLPSKLMQGLKLLMLAVALVIALISVVTVYTDNAVVKLKATDRWLLLGERDARPLWPLNAKAIDRTACKDDAAVIAEHSSFTAKEVVLVCSVITDEGAPSYVKKSIKGQRNSSIFLIVVMLVAAWITLMEFMSAYVAKRLARRNLSSEISGDQLLLDLDAD